MSDSAPKRLFDTVSAFNALTITMLSYAEGILLESVLIWLNPDFNYDLNCLIYGLFLIPQLIMAFSLAAIDFDRRGAYRTMKSCAVRLVFSTICSSGSLWVLYMSNATLSLASIMLLTLSPATTLAWNVRKLCNLWQLVFSDIKDYCQDRPDLKWGVTKWIVSKWRKLSSLLRLRDRCSMKWEFVIEVSFKALSWVLIWALIYFAIYIVHSTHIN